MRLLEKKVKPCPFWCEGMTRAIFEGVKRLPTIEPKRGKWIDGKYMGFDGCFVWHRECSECGYERDDDNPDKDTNFCPNCGAKMERSEDGET